jgi:hypothetical protein
MKADAVPSIGYLPCDLKLGRLAVGDFDYFGYLHHTTPWNTCRIESDISTKYKRQNLKAFEPEA